MNKKKIIILSLIFFIIIVSLFILFYNKNKVKNNDGGVQKVDTNFNNNLESEKNIELIKLSNEPAVTPEWYLSDKDGDGITDEEEDKIGTNKWESDSDFDGLSDKLEIEQYKTDPMKADTDGDTYLDGLEVLNNYDPLK